MKLTLITSILFFLISMSAACTSIQPITSTVGDGWQQYESQNFTLITDVSRTQANSILYDLEDFRHFARQTLNPVGGLRPRLTVIAISRPINFAAFANPRTHGGLYFRTIDTDFMIINLDVAEVNANNFNGKFTAKNIIQHEYLHAVIADMPGKPLPLWYNEGLAEYFSTAYRVAERYVTGTPLENRLQDLLRVNRLSRGRRSLLGSRRRVTRGTQALELAPLKNIVEATSVSQVYRNSNDRTNYHAQAWLLSHYIYGAPENRPRLETLLQNRTSRETEITSIEEAFDSTLLQIDRNLWRRVRDKNFPITESEAPIEKPQPIIHVGPVDEAQMWCNVGRFKGFFSGAEDAKSSFRRALRIDPNNVCALTHLSKLESWDLNLKIAEELTQRAESLDRTDPFTPLSRAMIYYNQIRMLERQDKEIPAQLYKDGIKWAQETIRLDPSIALSYIVHASLADSNPNANRADLTAALADSLEAERLLPQNSEIKISTGILNSRLGDREKARQKFFYTVNWSRSEKLRKIARLYIELGERAISEQSRVPGKEDLQ